jgi:hypothetical protein
MTLTRKQFKRTTRRGARKPRATWTTRQAIARIDAMIPPSKLITPPGLTEELFGVAGKGTWDAYDLDLDWKRFSEWQTR